MRRGEITDRNREYWSIRAGAAGMAIAKTMPTSTSLAEVGLCANGLAKDEPGRAAVLSFLVERSSKLLEGTPDAASFVRAVQASFDDRLVLALAPFTEPARGLAAVLVRPRTSREDDAEGAREALLGDLEVLAATQRGDRSAWSRAQTRSSRPRWRRRAAGPGWQR